MSVQAHDALAFTADVVERALAAGRPALDEAAAKQVLAAYGVRVPRGGLAHSAAEAAALTASLGAPVAMKATGALIQHKTEKQLVVLDVRSSEEAAATYTALAERAGDALEAVLVEEMVAGSREFMAGMNRDAAFGPVVAFGLGGTMTEVFHDIALAVTPGSEGDVAELPGLIRGKALLGPFRGQVPVDRGELTDGPRGRRADRRRPSADRRDRRQPDPHPRLRAGRRRRLDGAVGGARGDAARADVHAGPRGGAGAAVRGRRRRLRRRHPLGRLRRPEHPRRRVQRRHLPGEPQRRRVLRPPRLDRSRRPPGRARSGAPRCRRTATVGDHPAVRRGRRARRRRHRGRVLGDGRRRQGGRGGTRRRRRRGRRHAHRPQLHGADRERHRAARHRVHRAPPAPGQPRDRLAVRQPRRAALGPRRSPGPRRALLHRGRQRGAGECGGRTRVPGRRRRDLVRARLPGGHRRRPPPLRRGRSRPAARSRSWCCAAA